MLELEVYDPTGTQKLGELTKASLKTLVLEHNGHGFGTFAVDRESAQHALIAPRRRVRWYWQGVHRATTIMEDRPSTIVDPGGIPATQVDGLTLSGLLDRAVIYPTALLNTRTAQTVRRWGWVSLGYNAPASDGWGNLTISRTIAQQQSPPAGIPGLRGKPRGWRDGRAEWIQPEAYTVDPETGRTFHPGTNEFLLRRVLPASWVGRGRLDVAANDEADVFLDGHLLGQAGGGYDSMTEFEVEGEGREMVLAFHVRHTRNLAAIHSLCTVMASIQKLDERGRPNGTAFRTYSPARYGGDVPHTWRILPNPEDLPGVSPGRPLVALFDEAKARGALPGLTRSFTNGADSAGLPWEATVNVEWPIGTPLTDVLAELVLHGIDWTVDEAGGFHVWNRRGQDRDLALGPFVEAAVSGEDVRATSMLGQLHTGYVESTRNVDKFGRVEAFAAYGTQPDRHTARTLAARQLRHLARERNVYDYVLSDTSPVAFDDFGVGDTLPAGRVTQFTFDQDDTGGNVNVAVTVEPEEDL